MLYILRDMIIYYGINPNQIQITAIKMQNQMNQFDNLKFGISCIGSYLLFGYCFF
jgi:hypothetical protein